MLPTVVLVLPFTLLPFGLALLYRSNGGWRTTLGLALSSVAGWFALLWGLVSLLLWFASLDSCLRSPRTFNEASAAMVLGLGYAWVFGLAVRARKARAATLLGIALSCLLFLSALAVANV